MRGRKQKGIFWGDLSVKSLVEIVATIICYLAVPECVYIDSSFNITDLKANAPLDSPKRDNDLCGIICTRVQHIF